MISVLVTVRSRWLPHADKLHSSIKQIIFIGYHKRVISKLPICVVSLLVKWGVRFVTVWFHPYRNVQLQSRGRHLRGGRLNGRSGQKSNALPQGMAYLDAVKNEVIESVQDFLTADEAPEENGADGLSNIAMLRERYSLRRFRVNVLVDL